MTTNDAEHEDGGVRNLIVNSLNGHSKRYKSYLTKLKQGQASGISQQFGRAADLLELLPAPEPIRKFSKDSLSISSQSSLSDAGIGRIAPELRVTSESDKWLWDVFYDGAEVYRVQMADGSLIARAEDCTDMVLIQNRASQPDSPRIVVLANIIVNPLNGNIYWQGSTGRTAGAFLNNGWQVDQLNGDDLEPVSFVVSEPQPEGGGSRAQHVVSALNIDLDNGDVIFEMPESGESVTLRSRKIVQV